MPTQQVDPTSNEALQEVANALLKSRKVIVVTGAGISTNSGIPDFRSENGLYSLIQEQLDSAERERRERERKGPSPSPEDEVLSASTSNDNSTSSDRDDDENEEGERASKRRRTSRDGSVHVTPEKTQSPVNDDALFLPALRPFDTATPLRPEPRYIAAALATSPLSSPPADFKSSAYRPRTFDFLRSSSPMSASTSTSGTPTPSRRSSVSDSGSEVGDTSFSSQKLPNMKGKDLFDASIWADPLRTKVFYTFTTTLRQKSRECVPTTSHHFISHLKSQGKLLRCYTQNIDRIEEKVGLTTELLDGPGSKGRGRARKSASNATQLAKMTEEAKDEPSSQVSLSQPSSQLSASQPTLSRQSTASGEGGVECVYLHGSLEQLRCFQCKRTSSWDDMEEQTLSGEQPECPHCTEATVAREEKGKRALGVGKLRPDIVLYGEEHPSSHLIGPLVEHDISRGADILLILGTSLKVHGLKILVREFANAIHKKNGKAKNGKVIFVNFTKPAESIWSDIIDYWVQWDCDAWVADLRARVPKLWDEEQPAEIKMKPPPTNPAESRNGHRVSAGYWTRRIHNSLCRITGNSMEWKIQNEAAVVQALPTPDETDVVTSEVQVARTGTEATVDIMVNTKTQPKAKAKVKARAKSTNPRKARKSAPAVIQQPTPPTSSSPSSSQMILSSPKVPASSPTRDDGHQPSSIFDSVKKNPRIRKRKMLFDGGEATLPTVTSRRDTLAPIVNAKQPPAPLGTMEPMSPPSGPIQALSSNFGSSVGGFFQKGLQYASHLPFMHTHSWFGAKTGFGGGMVDTTRGPYRPYQFKGGLLPSKQQVAPAEISKVDVPRVDAQRHSGRDTAAALAMAEMKAPRRSARLPR